MRRRWQYFLALSLLVVLAACSRGTEEGHPVVLTVSAAASLTFAFQDLGTLFTQETGIAVTFNFGASGHLAQQIARGAPVDLFAAANVAFIEDLERQGVILSDTIQPYARGHLTLWMRTDSPLRLSRLEDVARADVKRIAIANPSHAPYGVAARQALQTVGWWEALQPKLVMGENVRQTLQYAATGNVDVAIVALSLSVQHEGHWVLIPETLHSPIIQALAVVKNTPHEQEARRFAAFVLSDKGRERLRKYGFAVSP